uniref:Ig-like domain-containing protein n=1 Tax=Neogobius melanostomus TaxID=47308 RepID=A0A8C6SX86_9GOBI
MNKFKLFFCVRCELCQSHPDRHLWKSEGENATIKCSQTHGVFYYQMYWYRQRAGENMRQIVFTMISNPPEFEADLRMGDLKLQSPTLESGTLTVGEVAPGDTGVYFCAVREHSASKKCKTSTKPSEILNSRF